MKKIRRSPFEPVRARRRRSLPLFLVGAAVSTVIALAVGVVFVLPHLGSHAADVNMDCTLIVPPHPLTAQGLATPYQLTATDGDKGPCNEANPNQASFVQGAVFDRATGQISIYNPLVVDQGTQPAAAPVVPKLPRGAIVALWFGSNANTLTLRGRRDSLQQGHCVNGAGGTIFGQVSYCNAPAFFQAANAAIKAGRLKVPALAKANDGMTCPTTRDFSIVDQDQSDNVTTAYLLNGDGQTAQDTPTNAANITNAVAKNGSDERLVTLVDSALGCTPWKAPDLASPGQMLSALPLNELQAAADQNAPVALVPAGDPMVLNNGNANLRKLDAYRVGVDQLPVANLDAASTRAYCQNLLNIAPARLQLDSQFTQQAASPDAAVATNLFTFLAQRFVTTFEGNGLNCTNILGVQDPVTVQANGDGVVTSATINLNGTTSPSSFNCSVNGNVLQGCNGNATINGQQCVFKVDNENHQVNITCPQQAQGEQPPQQQPSQEQPLQQPQQPQQPQGQ